MTTHPFPSLGYGGFVTRPQLNKDFSVLLCRGGKGRKGGGASDSFPLHGTLGTTVTYKKITSLKGPVAVKQSLEENSL